MLPATDVSFMMFVMCLDIEIGKIRFELTKMYDLLWNTFNYSWFNTINQKVKTVLLINFHVFIRVVSDFPTKIRIGIACI